MKKLLMIGILVLTACNVREPESLSIIKFPEDWQGYYEKFMGVSILDEVEFKISKDYITFKSSYFPLQSNRFRTFKIRRLHTDYRYPDDLIVSLDSAYDGQESKDDYDNPYMDESVLTNGFIRLHRKSGKVYLYHSLLSWTFGSTGREVAIYNQVNRN